MGRNSRTKWKRRRFDNDMYPNGSTCIYIYISYARVIENFVFNEKNIYSEITNVISYK